MQNTASSKGMHCLQIEQTEGRDGFWPRIKPAESGEQHKPRLPHLHRDGLSRLRVKGLTDLERDELFLSTVGKIWRIGLQHDKELKYIINPGHEQMDCSQKQEMILSMRQRFSLVFLGAVRLMSGCLDGSSTTNLFSTGFHTPRTHKIN